MMNSFRRFWNEEELNGQIDYVERLHILEQNNTWHDLFRSPKWIPFAPAEEVIDFFNEFIQNPCRQLQARSPLTIQNVHDLGCGGGRHVLFFAEKGFNVTGSDLSSRAIERTRTELDRREMDARLVQCPMTSLPFNDGEFDMTLSRAVMNHSDIQGMKKGVYEVARTTRSGGLLFLTVSSIRASDYMKGHEADAELSYIPTSGPEQGLIHTFFTASDIACLVEPFFRIEKLTLSEHPPLLASAPGATDATEYFGSEYVIVGIRR